MNHYHKLSDSLVYYKEKGIEKVVLCLADPISGWIKNEIADLKIEDFYDVEVGNHQFRIRQDENENILLVLLSKGQLYSVYPDVLARLIDTKYAEKPALEFRLIDYTISHSMPLGYCHLDTHKGCLSKSMLDNRKCVFKQCPYLERYESHPYWHQKKDAKEKKKQKKLTRCK